MKNLSLLFGQAKNKKNAMDALTSISFASIVTLLLTGCGGAAPIDLNAPPHDASDPITDVDVDEDEDEDDGNSDGNMDEDDNLETPTAIDTSYTVEGTYCSCGPSSEVSSSINRDTEDLEHLDGVLVRISWTDMNPQAGIYDWSYLDEQISYAVERDTKISLAILNGSNAPDWLEDEGATLFEYTLRGNTVFLPLPWDDVYLSYYQDFIAELGARYKNNDSISLVHATNSTTNGFEMHYTFDSTATTQFEDAGYTEDVLISSWTTIVDAYATAFPDTPIDVEVHPVFFSDNVATAVVNYGLETYGKRFGVLAAWWSEHNAKNVYTGMYAIMQTAQEVSFAGVQLVGAVSAGLNPLTEEELGAALQLAIDNGFLYMEIWNDDLANPDLDELIIANDESIEAQSANL